MGDPIGTRSTAAASAADSAAGQPGRADDAAVKSLDGARANLRETAKWIVTGTGGIVALVIGSSPFTGLGSFELTDPRLWVAVACLVAGCLLSWLPLRSALEVIPTNLVSLDELAVKDELAETRVRVDKLLLNKFPEKIGTVRKLNDVYEDDKSRMLKGDREAEAELDVLQPYVDYTLELCLTQELRVRFERLIRTMKFCGPFIIIAFVALAWAANPGRNELILDHPRVVSIPFLAENEVELRALGVPDVCYKPALRAMMTVDEGLGRTGAVTLPDSGCPVVRLQLNSNNLVVGGTK